MNAIIRYALRDIRSLVIGWGAVMLLIGLVTVPSYKMVAQNSESIQQLMENMPRIFAYLMGDVSEMTSPTGYLGVKYYALLPVILGMFSITTGASMLARDEEAGVLDLIMAQPVSRGQLYAGRLVAGAIGTFGIVVLCWIGLVIGMVIYPLPITTMQMALPLVSLFAVLLVLQRFAILVSQLLPSRGLTTLLATLFLFGSFFLTAFARMNTWLEPAAKLSPMTYYQSADAIRRFDWGAFLGLLVVAEVLALLGYWRFARRDIRLSGEGGFDYLRSLWRRNRD